MSNHEQFLANKRKAVSYDSSIDTSNMNAMVEQNNHQLDLVRLIREALVENGCDPNLVNGCNFDAQSTISLDFDSMPSLLISIIEDTVFIWASITQYDFKSKEIYDVNNNDIVARLSEPCSYSACREIYCKFSEATGFQIKIAVEASYLYDSKKFSHVLEDFFQHINHFHTLFQ